MLMNAADDDDDDPFYDPCCFMFDPRDGEVVIVYGHVRGIQWRRERSQLRTIGIVQN
jgi:hypothetical protein